MLKKNALLSLSRRLEREKSRKKRITAAREASPRINQIRMG
ncbi:MAG: hypothetical protein ACE5L7_05450 [Candidatus Aminicenantales bacterium]